jgi:A/G-specific adenine glycosylase
VNQEVSVEMLEQFRAGVLSYWDQFGRRTLPWRQTNDPWKLLLAEVLLRKTTSWQAAKVYTQIAEFSVEDIANMDTTDLESMVQPIGLYKVRAAQLKIIAAAVAEQIQAGRNPFQSDRFLRSLPGIGRYISNAVRCCAYGDPLPALDTNMIRVVQRVFNWQSNRKRPREDRKLWEFAETLVPVKNSREFNWGILDLGAAVCLPKKPRCGECVLNGICAYYNSIKRDQVV